MDSLITYNIEAIIMDLKERNNDEPEDTVSEQNCTCIHLFYANIQSKTRKNSIFDYRFWSWLPERLSGKHIPKNQLDY